MRRALLLPLLLAGCLGDAAPTGTVPDTTADDLLRRVDQEAVADAFLRLTETDPTLGYLADLEVTEWDADGSEVGAAAWTLRWREREPEVDRHPGSGTLSDRPESTPALRDPIDDALSDDPPFLDPAARDQYRRTVVGDTVVAGRRLQVVEAVLTDLDRAQAVRRVRAAVDPDTGQPVVVEVERAQDAALYDETSRVRVELAPVGGGWVPRHVTTDTRTAVPFAGARRVRTEWTVRAVGGQPLAPGGAVAR